MTVDKVQGPLNNVVNGNTGSAPAQPVTTETSTPIFDESSKKKKLTEEDIKVMKAIGLNPDDPAAIEQWNTMDEATKENVITKYYEQLQNNSGHITPDSPEQKTPSAPSDNAAQVVTTNQDTPETPVEEPVKTVSPSEETPVTTSTASAVSTVEEEVTATHKKQPEGEEVVQADSDEAAQFEKTEPIALRENIGLEPIKLSEKPSLVSLATTKSMETILKETKVKMQDITYENNVNLVKNFITKDMWKSMPEEERIKVLQSMLPPEFQNLSQEEKDKRFNEFLEHRVKQDRGISDERWNNFSDERKAKLRMKYALDFDIAIKKGFTEDEVDKISNYDRLIYGTQKLEESYNSLSEEQKVSKSGLAMKARIEAGKHVGQTINDVSTLLTSIDENGEILQNIEVSKTREYEIKNKVKYSEISDEKVKRNLIKQDARSVAQTLKNSPTEKRIENLKNILLGSSSDTAYLADLLFQVTREMKLSKEEAAALHNEIHEASGLIAKENEALSARCENSEQSKPEQKKLNEDVEHRKKVQSNLDIVIATNYTSDLSEYNAQELAKRTIKHNNDTAVNNMKEAIGKDKTRAYTPTICEFLKNKKYSEGTIEKTTSNKGFEIKKEVAAGVVNLVNNGEIAAEVIKSEVPALYKPAEGKEADPESQLDIQEMFHTGAPGNAAVIKAEQKAMLAGYIHKDAEVKFYQAGFEESKKLPETEAIQSQKDWSDVIPSVHKDNQLALHEITMTSQYEEVQEYATNNISRYDESVQADAIKASVNTGNQKVIDAAAKVANEITYEKNASKSDNSNIANSHEIQKAVQDVEVKYQKNITSKVADTFAKNNLEPGNVAVEGLSESEKREYYAKQFENSTIQEQYRLLSRLPDSMKKDVYSKMAMYCPNMLKSIAGTYGADILKLSGVLPLNVICIVAKAMLTAGGSSKVDGAKFILKTDYFSPVVEKQAKEIIYGSNAADMENGNDAPKEQYTTAPLQNDRFMKSTFASNFNDINYRKIYKNMPPIRG